MNNFVFGKYQNNDSLLNKLDVRVKLLSMFIIMIFIFLQYNFFLYIGLFSFILTLFFLSKGKIKSLIKIIKSMLFMFVFLLIINLFFIKEGRVLFQIGNSLFYDTAFYQTGFIVLRIIMIFILSSILTVSSKPTDLTYGIEFYLHPLQKLKIDIHEIAIMISIAIRFIPTLIEETMLVMKAQSSRGVDFKYGKVKDRLIAFTSLIVPLFIISFQRADELANAMIVRGYQKENKRSKYRRFKISALDITSFVCLIVFLFGLRFINGVLI